MNDLEFTIRMKDEATAQIAKVKKEIDGVAGTLPKMQQNAQSTTQAMINFNRVVSDAPYGLIGIANNIDPMIQSFSKLKSETGSTGSAIKTMLGALTSPAGISLAISLATSLAIAFGPKLIAMFKSTTNEAENFNLQMEKLNTQLKIWQKDAQAYVNEFSELSDIDLMKKAASVEADLQRYRRALEETTAALKTAKDEQKIQLERMQSQFSVYVASLEMASDKIVSEIKDRKESVIAYAKETQNSLRIMRHAMAINDVKQLALEMDKIKKSFADINPYLTETANKLNEISYEHSVSSFNYIRDEFLKTGDMVNLFYSGLSEGFATLSNEIGNGLYRNIENALGGANSLLEKFIASAVAKIGEQLAMKGLKSLLSMIPGVGSLAAFLPFHSGGIVPKAHSGAYINAPSNREFPILVRGGETVRTEAQESALRSRGGSNVTINFNSPVSDSAFVVSSIKKALRETGMTADKLFVNNAHSVAFA